MAEALNDSSNLGIAPLAQNYRYVSWAWDRKFDSSTPACQISALGKNYIKNALGRNLNPVHRQIPGQNNSTAIC
jgi:hypothetical protein